MASRDEEKLAAKQALKSLDAELAKLRDAEIKDVDAINARLKERAKLENDLKETAEDRALIAAKELENAADNLRIMERVAELDGDREGLQDVLLAQSDAAVKLKQAELEVLIEQVKNGEKTEEQIIKKKKDLEDELATLQAQDKLLNDQKKAYEEIGDKVAGTLGGMAGMKQASESLVGQLFLAGGAAGGMEGALSNIGKSLKATFSPANVMYNLMEKVGEASMAAFISTDQFRADLAKAGASLDQYGGMMQDVSADTQAAGASMKDTQQAILGLHAGMAGFNTMAEADQKTLVATTAVMSKLGVDAATSAGNLNILTKSMGLLPQEADKANKEMAATANALGVSQAKMAADFAAAAPQLSAHGSAGVQVFRKLAAQSKATGIEMSTLLGIAGQFDTFEGSAEAAGKLNAVLGTQINSIDLLTATEDERIKILRDSVDASGKSWESMNKFEKQMVASAAGISDVNEAGKLFGTTAREMENAANAAEKMALADKELQAQAANASTAKEKLTLIAERFGVVMIPLIDGVHFLLDGILLLNQGFGGYLIPTLIGFLGVIFLIHKAQQAWIAIQKSSIALSILQWTWSKIKRIGALLMIPILWALSFAKDKETISTIANTASDAASIPVKKVSNEVTKQSIGPTLAFGFAMLMLGGGIFLAAYGMSLFVKAFSTLPPGMIWGVVAALAVFAVTMVILALIMSTLGAAAVGPMLAFGFAFLMIGAGVMLAAIGFALVITALGEFFGILAANFMIIPLVALGIVMLGLSLYVLAGGMVALAFATPAMITVAFGLLILSVAVFEMGIAMMIMAVAVAIVAISMPIIVSSLERLSLIGSALTEAALGMGLLVLAFGGLAILSLFITPIVIMVGVLTLGILALASALSLIKTDDLRAVADMAMGIGSITIESAQAFDNAMVSTREAVVAIASEPEASTLLANTANAFAAQKAGAAGAGGAGGAGGAAGATPAGERTIILKLDKREFGRAVINIFEKEQDLNRVK
jgi:hypothetical protein